MRRIVTVAATAAAASLCAAAAAAVDPATGFYIGAGVGGTHFDQDFGADVRNAYAGSPFTVPSASMMDKSGTLVQIYSGWQFHPNFALEAAYADLGKVKAAYTLDRQGPFTRNAEYKVSAASLAIVGSLPVAASFGLLAKAGVAWTKLEYSETGDDRGTPFSFSAPDLNQTRAMAGLGATYAATPNLAIRAEWDRYFDVGNTFALTTEGNGRFSAIDAFWIGVQYRF